MDVIKHEYFKEVIANEWNEFYSSKEFYIPYFEQNIQVKLVEYDEDFEPIEEALSKELIDEYAETLNNFIENIDTIIKDIQKIAFEYYLRVYAKYYEKPFEVIFENEKIKSVESGQLHEPLQINSKEKHFEYMNRGLYDIEISNHKTIVIPFRYAIDEEHGLEVKIINNKVVKVGGIAETIYR